MALGSTQPLTEMSTRSISCGKGGRCVRLKTYHHPVSLSRNLGTLTSWNTQGHSRPVMGLLYLYLYLYMNFAVYMAFSFITFLVPFCIAVYMVFIYCMRLFNFESYLFLL